MGNHVPFVRGDMGVSDAKDIMAWLRGDELLQRTKHLSPDDEFVILLEFLIEFAGGHELAEHRMYEMCVEQAALSCMAWAETMRKVKGRLLELYSGKESRKEAREHMWADVNAGAVMKIDIDEGAAFRMLCKTLRMDFVLDEDGGFYVNKEDGSVWEKIGEGDRRIDDRGGLFIALRNVAVNMFPNLYFRSKEYIWEHPWQE